MRSAIEMFRPQLLRASCPFFEDVGIFLPLGGERTAMGWEAVAHGTIENDLGR
jgi:hypothetical protein